MLSTLGGKSLKVASNVASRISDDPAGSLLRSGNFQSYAANPYMAWTGMWGVSSRPLLVATSSVRVSPTLFPATTKFTWDVTPDPNFTTQVNGYLNVSYGNYDDSAGVITPRQVKNITTLSVNTDWTFTGDASSALLSECWLTTTAHASGALSDKVFEVAFFPKNSTGSTAYLNTLSAVGAGSFTDSNGVLWNVRGNTGTVPYLIAYRPGFADFTGVLPFKDYLTFLTSAGKITGNEYFNGLGFGVEPKSGVGTLTINTFTPTYT